MHCATCNFLEIEKGLRNAKYTAGWWYRTSVLPVREASGLRSLSCCQYIPLAQALVVGRVYFECSSMPT